MWKEWLSSTAAASPSSTPPTRSSSNRRNAHVVVVGCGRVGSELATSLEGGGHVAVIDKAASAFRRLPDSFQGERVEGYGFDREALRDAGIERAAAFAAVTNGDNSNILAAACVARETFGLERVVARIYDPRRAVIYQRLGVPTVPTVSWTTDQVLRRLVPEDRAPEWTDPTGGLVLVERELPARWVGRRLDELDEPETLRLVGVTGSAEQPSPHPMPSAKTGTVSIAATASALALLDQRLQDSGGL